MDASATAFRVTLTAEGTARLRDTVKEKLKKFMGDYTDDTLVEYVIVLLRNGRQKEEARKELDVFLGDGSKSFVSWLWDHLNEYSHLYMQTAEEAGMKETSERHATLRNVASNDSESLFNHEKEKSARPRTRHNREWKGLIRDDAMPLILQSSVVDDNQTSDPHCNPVGASSPKLQIRKKRNRQEDEPAIKEGEASKHAKLDAPRRLLQFAVRDAVGTVQKVPARAEPSLNVPCSDIRATTVDTTSVERPRKMRSVAIASGIAASAVKAVTEAAEDVAKARGSRSAKTLLVQKDKDVMPTRQGSVWTANGTSSTVSRNNLNPSLNTGPNASQGSLNIPVKANTWKPQHYPLPQQRRKMRGKVAAEGTVGDAVKLDTRVIKDTAADIAPRKSETIRRDGPNVVKKPLPSSHGAFSSAGPSCDADSRTVFVSNVHFAATKDTLSRHFNKFGEVLKVIILMDSATGQPKGSAYVEFLRKESAELALSLHGTSFMSRILKVVKRSAAHHAAAAAAMPPWPRIGRSSAFPPRVGRVPYPRGYMATNLRLRPPVKPGPRSFQWKRDNPSGSNNAASKPSQNPTAACTARSPAGRKLTYIRPEAKTGGSMGLV